MSSGVRMLDYDPQLATLVEAPPHGDGWVHEQKFDGYRIGLRKTGNAVELWSRRGQEWSAQFPDVTAAGRALNARRALLDGEVAMLLPSGVTSFQALQRRATGAALIYFAFDLLHLDGRDLRGAPIEERKRLLRRLVGRRRGGTIRYSDHVLGGGTQFYRRACALGLEGIVSKKAGSPYRAGRNLDWQKTKCLRRQELVIGGFTDPEGSREAVGALLVGYYEGTALRWAGKVGTGAGWNAAYLRDLRRRLDRLGTDASPFDPPVADAGLRRSAHWVRPRLVVEVAFAEWTDDGRVRHPSMQGLRADKDPHDVRRERPAAADGDRPVVAGIGISHPDRVIYRDVGITKIDIARYYDAVAERMVPHLAGRPLTLLRCGSSIDPVAPKGGCVMMRHGTAWGPDALRRVRIQELSKTGEYLIADDRRALVALAQMGIVEIHTWNARAETPYQHDRVVIDLDPGPEVGWPEVVAAAKLVRQALDGLGLRSWVKTTGGRGLHVVAPIRAAPVARCLAFARAVAATVIEHGNGRFTTANPKRGRERQILIDTLRNNRTNTSVAGYSLRARASAPVSMPIAWDELSARRTPGRFTIATVPRRLERDADPWAGYWSADQRLPA